MNSNIQFLVVGAGLFGATVANGLAMRHGCKVLVIDKNPHPGGSAWSEFDPETGIECHRYGSHIFHTEDREVWDYVQQFDRMNGYRHRVYTNYRDRVYPMPFNLKLLNDFFGMNLKPFEVEDFIRKQTDGMIPENARNFEEKAIALVGKELYGAFIREYTRKQWGCPPEELPASILTRLPVYHDYRSEYFATPLQGCPVNGYGALVGKMLDHPLISLELNTDYLEARKRFPVGIPTVYSGCLDRLFGFRYGALEWRSLRFEWETMPYRDFQGTSVMNYAGGEIPYTRIHEFKHYHPERRQVFESPKTVICREYPSPWREGMEPYYPVNNPENNRLQEKYLQEASRIPNFFAGGRQGEYRYFDMDRTIRNALDMLNKIKEQFFK